MQRLTQSRTVISCLATLLVVGFAGSGAAIEKQTTLSDPTIPFQAASDHHVVLSRDNITAIIVDNEAIDISALPNHRAGYNGVASLTHIDQTTNLFVPGIAGLNFEHIHDGTRAGLVEKFEPRKFPMELRIIDPVTVELYQPATGNWQLESCGRYRLLEGGVIEYTFECIPRAVDYRHDFIGLFWASYIQQPQSKSIHFQGRPAGSESGPQWIQADSPQHGTDSTHPPSGAGSLPQIDADFPLTLVNHPSAFEYTSPWYFGVSGNMAFLQVFRGRDEIWFAQSPSGGGNGNPAWDFQWFIRQPKVGHVYGFTMRAACVPFESRDQIMRLAETLRLD